MKQEIIKIVKSNKNAMKWLNNEEIIKVEKFTNNYHKHINGYIINEKVQLRIVENMGSTRRYIYNRFVKIKDYSKYQDKEYVTLETL